MNCKKIIQNYYIDINNLVDMLTKLVNSYRLLIGGAQELNTVALARKNDVKDALRRAENLGEVIDKITKSLDKACHNYLDYCKIKSDIIKCKVKIEYIQTEIDEELKLKE